MQTETQAEIVPAAKTTVAEYSKTAAGLAELRSKYEGATYETATPAGMKLAIASRAELRTVRVDLEKMRKAIKEPALRRCQEIDSEAKRITAEIEALEAPIDAQIKAEENRKADEKAAKDRAEKERAEAVALRITNIRALPVACIGKTSAEIAPMLEAARVVSIDGMDGADLILAESARSVAVAQIRVAMEAAQAREGEAARIAVERAELEAERAKQAAALAAEKAAADAARAEADRIAKAERDRASASAAAERAQIEADRRATAERERVAREQEERLARAERDRVETQHQERMAKERAENDARRVAVEAEEKRLADEAAAFERRRYEERIATTSLLDASIAAHQLLVRHDLGERIETLTLSAAIDRAQNGATT